MTSCRQRVFLLLAGILACWYCVGETHGVGRERFDVWGTVVDSEGLGVDEALVVLIEIRPDEVVVWDRPEHYPGAFVTRADLRGMFVIVDVPASSYYVYARSGEGEAYLRAIGFRDGTPPPQDIQLSMTELHGTVFWPDGLTPVADAFVELESGYFVTRADEHGKFSFPGVEPRAYDVIAKTRVPLASRKADAVEAFMKKGGHRSLFDSLTRPFEEIRVQSRATVALDQATQLTMLFPGGIVHGVVMTDDGLPVVGARVSGGRRADMTDHAGHFELTHLPIGRCHMQVQGRNHEIGRATVEVAHGGDPAWVEITLYPFRPQVTFRFTTPDGAVIANEVFARVNRRYARGKMASQGLGGFKTDENGEWRNQWMYSGSCHYAFFSKTFGYAEQTVVIGEGVAEVHHGLTLDPGGSICGIVRDQLTGAPLGGVVLRPVRVEVNSTYDEQSLWNSFGGFLRRSVMDPVSQISRDGDGTFCLRHLPPGSYRISISGVGLGEQFTLEEAEDVSGVEIMVETALAQRWIIGRVLGPNNAPVVNTEVTFVIHHGGPPGPFGRSYGVPRRAVTDDLGMFRVGPLHARDYFLSAKMPGHRSEMTPIDVTAGSIDAGDIHLSTTPSR